MPININSEHQAGTIMACTNSNILSSPIGYLKCDGSAVSRTDFSRLFSAIGTTYGTGNGSTTFNLPDLRGEFLRGLDEGRGVDTGRTIGVAQSAQNLSHSHTVNSHNHGGGSHTHNYYDNYMTTTQTPMAVGGPWGPINLYSTTEGPNQTVISSQSPGTDSNGGADSRPRNLAVIYFIKY